MTIAEMLKQLRVENELTQKQLGDSCFMKDSQIRRYENGHSIPNSVTLENILVIFNLAYCIESKQKESVKYVFNFSFADQTAQIYYFNLHKNFSRIIDPLKDKTTFYRLKHCINTIDSNSALFHESSYNKIKHALIAYDKLDKNDILDKNILNKVILLNDLGKQKVIDYMDDLAQMNKYKK